VTILRLLLLLAVLLMPFGMAAPAAAHGAGASVVMVHCPEQPLSKGAHRHFAECTMACSAALPATELARDTPRSIVCVPAETAVAQHLHGLDPEIATPPPRRG
jgi:hypothetical protein